MVQLIVVLLIKLRQLLVSTNCKNHKNSGTQTLKDNGDDFKPPYIIMAFWRRIKHKDTKYTDYMKVNDKLTKDIRDRISNITRTNTLGLIPDPQKYFTAQTITLSSNDYDILEILF